MIISRLLLATSLILFSAVAWSYEVDTHEVFSSKAVNKSSLISNPKVSFSLGINLNDLFPNKRGIKKNTPWFFMNGARREDDFPRPLHHFFNPLDHDEKIVPQGAGWVSHISPDWALEDNEDKVISFQEYSYKEAKEYLYQALTSTEKSERDKNFGLVFRSLGHVIHHVQDMSQPQHTRMDQHLDLNQNGVNDPLLPFENVSQYEQYTNDRREILSYDGYEPVQLSLPRKYWYTSALGRGLADYSNRGFISEGTNFDFDPTKFLSPWYDPTTATLEEVTHLFTQATDHKGNPESPPPLCAVPNSCYMIFFENFVHDYYRLEESKTNTRASTFSLYDQYIKAYGKVIHYTLGDSSWTVDSTKGLFSYNRFNIDKAHEFLLPRAVGYSAGLINYFFRGEMTISPPEEGIYSIIDHSTVNQKDSEGFSKIKLKLKNTTKDIVESEDLAPIVQDMHQGKLIAIARFRRNTCYEPNLAGEFNLSGTRTWNGSCVIDNYRTPEEEYIVSQEEVINYLPADDSADPNDLVFDFNPPIPINATDLYLQVVYRGKLGEEDDAVAVTRVDLSEPTYFSMVNGSDYFMVDGEFYTHDTINSDPALLGNLGRLYDTTDAIDFESINIQFSPNQTVAEISHLPPSSFTRIAYLTDKSSNKLNYTYKAYLNEPYFQGDLVEANMNGSGSPIVLSKVNQENQYSNTVGAVSLAREVYYWHMNYFFQSNNYNWSGALTPQELQARIEELPGLSNIAGIPVNINF